MNKENREIRTTAELRFDADNADSRTIEGYAVVYDSWSRDLGGFNEIIHRGAITPELVAASDVVMCVNHDENKMLARSHNGDGTLLLELRDDGLYFMFDAPRTPLGDELLYNVRAKNLFECSFAFTIPEGGDKWTRGIDGTLKREINKIDGLYDCSIVTHAAYPATSVSARFAAVKKTADELDAQLDAELNQINNM